jgi:hypothetical protein
MLLVNDELVNQVISRSNALDYQPTRLFDVSIHHLEILRELAWLVSATVAAGMSGMSRMIGVQANTKNVDIALVRHR